MTFKRFEIGDIVDSSDPRDGDDIDLTDTGSYDKKSGGSGSAEYESIKNLVYPYNPSEFDEVFDAETIYIYGIKRTLYKERKSTKKQVFIGKT